MSSKVEKLLKAAEIARSERQQLGEVAGIVDSVEELQAIKINEIGEACTAIIYAGIEAETTQGLERFSLNERDLLELFAQRDKVLAGAPAVPYHADGKLCRMFDADEFMAVVKAAEAHIFYNRTLANTYNGWIRRSETWEELQEIYHGVSLPDDLQEHLDNLIATVSGGAQ